MEENKKILDDELKSVEDIEEEDNNSTEEENEKLIDNEPSEVENSESDDKELIDSETSNLESVEEEILPSDSLEITEDLEESEIEEISDDTESIIEEESTTPDSTEIIEDLEESEINEMSEDDDSLESELPQHESLETQIRSLQKNLIEGALYASGRPLDVEELSTKLEIPKKITNELVKELAFEYLERTSAIIINQVGEKFQMALKTEYVEKVAKFAKGGGIAERYLRTLTIIALKQPILKSTVIKIRGSGAYEHVKYLLDNDFISATKKGRTHELLTTDKYSEMFGLPKNKQELKKAMIEQLGIQEEEVEKEESPQPKPEE